MPQNTKIATCKYCGTRAVLMLAGGVRHELACSSCGAPLHELKMMPQAKVAASAIESPKAKPKTKVRIAEVPEYRDRERDAYRGRCGSTSKKKKSYKKKRKTWVTRVLDEAWDVVEDVFD